MTAEMKDHEAWVRGLSEDSFLAIFDVALDIHKALELSIKKNVEIPLLQTLVKFPSLFPADGAVMRDRYCVLRSSATAMLKEKGVIKDFAEIRTVHRWQNVISIEAEKAAVDRFVRMMNAVHMERAKGPAHSATGPSTNNSTLSHEPVEECRKLFMRFHTVAVQLKKRHGGRTPFTVEDEYDTQDLLRALLSLRFDDIRSEEWTPSYAGRSARVDFLLKQEKVVIEVKKQREGLGAKEIGEQLIIDIERYKTHPDCRHLLCFVYDPEHRLVNPHGLENDLTGPRGAMDVQVFVAPSR